jgi:hypothetical protein
MGHVKEPTQLDAINEILKSRGLPEIRTFECLPSDYAVAVTHGLPSEVAALELRLRERIYNIETAAKKELTGLPGGTAHEMAPLIIERMKATIQPLLDELARLYAVHGTSIMTIKLPDYHEVRTDETTIL